MSKEHQSVGKEDVGKLNLVPADGGSLVALPDHLKDVHGHEGMEQVRKKDLVIPRLGIGQGQNPQMKRSNPLYIEGLRDGEFFNPVTNDVYGDTLSFIALSYGPSRILFEQTEDDKPTGKILCRSNNAIDGGSISPTCDTCPKSQWRNGGKTPPECTEFMNFPLILIGPKHLVISSFKSTGLKPTKMFLTKMDMLVNKWSKPLYSWVSEVKLNPDKNDAGEFYVPTFTVKRWATAEEFSFAESLFKEFKGKGTSVGELVTIDEEKKHQADEDIPF